MSIAEISSKRRSSDRVRVKVPRSVVYEVYASKVVGDPNIFHLSIIKVLFDIRVTTKVLYAGDRHCLLHFSAQSGIAGDPFSGRTILLAGIFGILRVPISTLMAILHSPERGGLSSPHLG